jgi:hypothetical protein
MTRRRVPRYDEDEDNLFDSLLDAEEFGFDDDIDDTPDYEDMDKLDALIEEEFANAKKRKVRQKRTR